MALSRRLRDPAYTGDQRCLPCTVLNLAILSLLVGVVTVAHPFLAFILAVGGLAAIWFRGYFVPFTPRFGPQLVDMFLIPDGWFTHRRETPSLTDSSAISGETVVERLADSGVLVVDGDELVLNLQFEDRWEREMAALADLSLESLASEARSVIHRDVSPFRSDGKGWLAVDGRHTLIARPVAVAELAAVNALEPAIDDESVRLAASGPLRQFLTDCPICETTLETASAVKCCGGHTSPRSSPTERYVCPTCEQELSRTPPAESPPEER